MKFVVIFEDASDADPGIRKRYMSDHLAFLENNQVEAAGPLKDGENRGRDGLWIVEAPERAKVEQLIREDPFWPTGLRASHAILEWKQVFANGKRLISA